jgi:hypothetical protein
VKAFPFLSARDRGGVIGLEKDKVEVIDVIKPDEPLYNSVFSNAVETGGYEVPTLEMMVVLKYAAMVSPFRDASDKAQDFADLKRVVLNNAGLDIEKVKKLAAVVCKDAPAEAERYILDIRAGRPIAI